MIIFHYQDKKSQYNNCQSQTLCGLHPQLCSPLHWEVAECGQLLWTFVMPRTKPIIFRYQAGATFCPLVYLQPKLIFFYDDAMFMWRLVLVRGWALRLELQTIHLFSQSRRRHLLGPSSGWKLLLQLSYLRIYKDTMLNGCWPQVDVRLGYVTGLKGRDVFKQAGVS